jgi:hypothetical protein
MPTKLTTEIITAAILGFEEQKRHIDTKMAELRAMLSGRPAESAARPEGTPRKRKRFSAASRRKMAMAQKARWAKLRSESEPAAPAKARKAKRQISEEGMKRIIAATKKRWRLQKAAMKPQSIASRKAVQARKKAAKKTAPAPAQAATQAAGQ